MREGGAADVPERERLVRLLTFGLFLYLPLSVTGIVVTTYLTSTRWSWVTVLARPETHSLEV